MKTPIAEAIRYRGWLIRLFLTQGGYSFEAKSPDPVLLEAMSDGWVYPSIPEAIAAARQFIRAEMVAISLGSWLADMYGSDRISQNEFESLYHSIRDAFLTGTTN